jgi:hypothetical protein
MLRATHRAADGIAADFGLYLAGAVFAGYTAAASTLPAHRAWGGLAVFGYAVAAVLAGAQLLAGGRAGRITRGRDSSMTQPSPRGHASDARPLADRWRGAPVRWSVLGLAWLAGTLLPLLVQAGQRAGGNPYRAQEEVVVIESGAARLLEGGTPYLTRDAIAAAPEPLLGYLPYQPGMVVFGLPRATFGTAWWTDARVWFALATAAVVVLALRRLRSAGTPDDLLVRAAQTVTVLPICALTLATGGDDLPVLALCLLAVALAGCGRWSGSGVAVGTAAALKLFAWPVAVVLLIHAIVRGSGTVSGAGSGTVPRSDSGPVRRLALPAVGIPVAVLLPVALAGPAAVWENVVRFPLGMGLVASPAASPLPGHLIATSVPGGRWLAAALLGIAGVALAVRAWRRPPRTAVAAATLCAVGLLVAILLMPATRFGYLLYPAGFAVWAVAVGRLAGTGRRAVPSKVV